MNPVSINFENLVKDIGEAVIISDRDEHILFWNASAERIFGYSPKEALGNTLSIITPERFRERHSKGSFIRWRLEKQSMAILCLGFQQSIKMVDRFRLPFL